MQKNELIVGNVRANGSNGEGIMDYNGSTVFIPQAIEGEQVEAKILKVKKNLVFAKLQTIIKKSPFRVIPKCKVYGKCGGCQLSHINYTKQLEIKAQIIRDCFSKIANVKLDQVEVVSSDKQYGYRNKLQLPIRRDDGINKIGFYANNSHRIIEINKCDLQPKWSEFIIKGIKEYINLSNIRCYNEQTNGGQLRHIVVREVQGKMLIMLVVTKPNIPKANTLVQIFSKYFDSFSLFVNVNKQNNNVILGDITTCIHGESQVEIVSHGIKNYIGALSFMQVNDYIKDVIYNDAIQALELNQDTIAIDAYSGAGQMTAMIAKNAKKAIGIEIIKEASICADRLAKENNLQDKMINVNGLSEVELKKVISREKKNGERIVLVLDPPRQGVQEQVIDSVLAEDIDRIVYISCSPQTLARDVKKLIDSKKYILESVKGYDMFPQTRHLETLLVLKKANS